MHRAAFTPGSPAAAGWRTPAEWERHHATWLTWPRREGISFPEKYEAVPAVYAALIRELVRGEQVSVNVWDAGMESWVRGLLDRHGVPLANVAFHAFPAYEPWCRDHGPIFLVRDTPGPAGRRERAVVDWDYNAWGGKYPPCDLDDAVPRHVARLRALPLFTPGMVLEGGAIDVNGRGSLLTTESCLLNPNRNPNLTRTEIEQRLRDYLGVTQILWLGEGIAGDDTDGHVDDLTRFVDPTSVVTVVEQDPADDNFAPLQDNLRRLQLMKTEAGTPLRVIILPMPRRVEHNGQRLPASYANFYIANERVVVPTYRDPHDGSALEILRGVFPDRRVVGLDSTDLVWGLGSFHCITQQEPAGDEGHS